MAHDSALLMVRERGWFSGLRNMLRKENGTWWRTKKWWVQILVWLLLTNGIPAFILWVIPLIDTGSPLPSGADGLGVFLQILGVASTIGVLILAQGIVVREKQMGTAAWILSNPVSRVAFILSKLIAHAFGILAIVFVLQGLVAYGQFSLRDGSLWPPLPLAAAMGLQALHAIFWLALSLMLGTFFNSRGPVLGIAFGVFFVQQILGQLEGLVPVVPAYMPMKLVELCMPVALSQPLPSVLPIISVVVSTVLFVLIAMWRFGRQEF
jgi:ABC-2 type transport system permease protein